MQTTRLAIRKAFKEINYSVTFQRNPFRDGLCAIGFKNSQLLRPVMQGNAVGVEFYKAHEQAFILIQSFAGSYLTDTDQKIAKV
jgi:hypothetical protein